MGILHNTFVVEVHHCLMDLANNVDKGHAFVKHRKILFSSPVSTCDAIM